MPPTDYEAELRGLPKKERKALQREFLRIQREDERKRRRRNKIILRTSLITVGVAAIAIAALVIVNNVRAGLAGPANMASDGVAFTGSSSDGTAANATITAATSSALQVGQTPTPTVLDTSTGVLRIVLYVDYASADAASFEKTNASNVQGWVGQGYASLEIHPVALNSTDGNDPSTRAANAVACVANTTPDAVIAVHNALIADQATIASAGLTDADLVTLVTKAGATDAAISKCITDNEFDNWVSDATARAKASVPNSDVPALTKVPLVLIDGTSYTGSLTDATAFETFVSDTYAKNTPASTATPTPTPTP
ncbi:DsbA family protein [Subtercola endophyticus]|uniref:DsbA family protein n=1 Tax=Subtercola endophyticus TaxID=2895559 RepID=UPI001E2931FD|nr:thioredoxin domain-containing protein [Subtercola endophyticus]UFS60793.1 thioredoxin domain-containing protein [Subtercola endophyticus]